ncbi:MAG: FAD-dependent oxidoreductase, partial [Acidimicrobiales bacterium]
MKRIVILGGGTAGTMASNRLRKRLDPAEWAITVVDQNDAHVYQPGNLFVPFGIYQPADLVKPRRRFLPEGVELVLSEIDHVEPEKNLVVLADERTLPYDFLIIATG